MYTKEQFIAESGDLFSRCPGNRVDIPGVGPTDLFDPPLVGFASADDELFEEFKDGQAIGSLFMSPREWLPEAETVAAFFFPLSEAVRSSNRADPVRPSVQWLYARIEGQQFINVFMARLRQQLADRGIASCVPGQDERFKTRFEPLSGEAGEDFHVNSRWSERHAAYACGLGTFGMSRGLITPRGMAGRFAGIVFAAKLAPDERGYSGVYDHCIRCGACARRCPMGAISMEHAKNNVLCSRYVDKTGELYAPRYGCGKCQVGVPCECQIPALAAGRG